MKLIGSPASPYVRKVRIVLAEKRIEHEFVLENVFAADTAIGTFNPLGKVPCLVLDRSPAMFDSRVIVEYLDALSPLNRLIPEAAPARAEVKNWEALADGVMDGGVLFVQESMGMFRPLEHRSPVWMGRQRGKVERGIAAMSKRLAEQPFCSGTEFSLADAAVGSALGWVALRIGDLDWRGAHANLARLYDRLMERPSFAATRPPA